MRGIKRGKTGLGFILFYSLILIISIFQIQASSSSYSDEAVISSPQLFSEKTSAISWGGGSKDPNVPKLDKRSLKDFGKNKKDKTIKYNISQKIKPSQKGQGIKIWNDKSF